MLLQSRGTLATRHWEGKGNRADGKPPVTANTLLTPVHWKGCPIRRPGRPITPQRMTNSPQNSFSPGSMSLENPLAKLTFAKQEHTDYIKNTDKYAVKVKVIIWMNSSGTRKTNPIIFFFFTISAAVGVI